MKKKMKFKTFRLDCFQDAQMICSDNKTYCFDTSVYVHYSCWHIFRQNGFTWIIHGHCLRVMGFGNKVHYS